MEKPMAFLDDAQHNGRNIYAAHEGKPWPREFLTLAIVSGCVAFWAVALLVAAAA